MMDLPGPQPFPVLGAGGNLLKFARDPLGYIDALFEQFGPIALLVKGRPTRIVSTEQSPGTVFFYGAELNRELLTGHEQFHKTALAGPLYPHEPVSERKRPLTRLLTGLFHVNGDAHRQQRRLLMPAFHKSRVESYRDDMVAISESILAGFRSGETRDLRPDMMELTLRVATKTLFGDDMGAAGVEVGRKLQRWLELFRPAAMLPLDLPGTPYRRWLDESRAIDQKMMELIGEKRRVARAGQDILAMLLEARDEAGAPMSDDELSGHAGVIFAAGYETTSNALSWTLFLLSQHPRIAADLLDELTAVLHGDAPSVEQLARLPLLERVIKESMRVLPPVPLNHRIAPVECELGGHRLEAGSELVSSIYHTHRMPELYPDPSHFRPERWEKLDPGPYAYNPFSAGPRMCIGAAFAMMELKIVLSILLQRYRFELAPGARVDRFFSITLSPSPGLPMCLHPQDREFSRSARDVRGKVREMVAL